MAFNNRGNACAFIGDFRAAIDDYGRAIELDPYLAMAYANRGLIFLVQGRQAEADKDFTQCLNLEPDMADKLRELSEFAAKARKP